MSREFALIAAVHTPFDRDGGCAWETIADQARHLGRAGVHGVFVAGTTGESLSLTVDERVELTRRWVDAGRRHDLRVVAHVGHPSLVDAARLAKDAETAGVDAIAAMAPSYFRPPTLDDLVGFCARVAEAAPQTPFYYYDIPAFTGVTFRMSAFLEAAAPSIPTLRGLKYTNSDLAELQRCVRLRDGAYDVLFGNDEALLAGVTLGATGAVGSSYNFAASIYHAVLEACRQGDLTRAREAQGVAVDWIGAIAAHGYLGAAKSLMATLGIDCGPPRPPVPSISPEARDRLVAELARLDFPFASA